MKSDQLGDRMKGYENVSKTKLLRRTPVIIRIDGKAFHTWTKCLPNVDASLVDGPFSEYMHKCMAATTYNLVENMQNAVVGYTQSDEISILLKDWTKLGTDQWFDGAIQKMASVGASMATAYFNRAWDSIAYSDKNPPAMFDARVFNVPKEEVTNYFLWRQQDATRNSVQMLGRHYFSHKQMHQKNVSNVQDMLMEQHGVNWNDLDTWKKRGTCIVRGGNVELDPDNTTGNEFRVFAPHNELIIDEDIPIFTQDRNYIDKHLKTDEE